jgi:hypothetical protein
VGFVWPHVLAWPLAIFAGWLGLAWGVKAFAIWRRGRIQGAPSEVVERAFADGELDSSSKGQP